MSLANTRRGALLASWFLMTWTVAGAAQEGDVPCERIGLTATCHSCTHAGFGPFADVTAQAADASFVYTAVDTPHTYYRIALPESAPSSYSGAVAYLSNDVTTSSFGFYTAGDVPIAIRAEGSATVLTPELTHDVTPANTDCTRVGYPTANLCDDALTFVRVFRLDADTTYRIVIGPVSAGPVGLVVENLSHFSTMVWPDVDGDGFGDGSLPISGWCEPPSGTVSDDTDCDDTRADVAPGAAEVCNGVDDDCDGELDPASCLADGGTDAGSVEGDAAVSPVEDAGAALPEEDAGAASRDGDSGPDAAPITGSDAGAGAPSTAELSSSSSGCSLTNGRGSMGGPVLLGLALLVMLRRARVARRRHSSATT